MIIEKNEKTYIVTELSNKWTVKAEKGKLLTAYDISKKVCSTVDELRVYIQESNLF